MHRASRVYTALGDYKAEFKVDSTFGITGDAFKIDAIYIEPGVGAILMDDNKVSRATIPWHSVYMFSVIHEEEPLIATNEGSVVGLDGNTLVS